MRRLAIIVIFDFEGHVDRYAEYLIKKTNDLVERLIIISNHELDTESKELLNDITSEIYERDNFGFDAGAYKDFFLNYLNSNEVANYDEVILLNDTYYGPLYPWNEMFELMEKQSVDFWGITKIYEFIDENGKQEPERLQSYFLVFNKKIIKDSSFLEYWKQLEYPHSYCEDITGFEIGLYMWLKESGYKDGTYVEYTGLTKECGVNPYRDEPFKLVSQYRCPVIRRKNFYGFSPSYNKSMSVMKYIRNNTEYNADYIIENIERLDDNGIIKWYKRKEIIDFCKSHTNIYIYGHGKVAKQVARYLSDLNLSFAGYVVKEKAPDEDAVQYSKELFSETDGIIIGVGDQYYREVFEMLKGDLPSEQILSMSRAAG